jgi:DNA end-binding protein Ku
VPAATEIPPQYYETPYYLAPADRGEKVYALLRETLRATGRVAVAQVVIRTTEHLAAVVPQGRALMLVTMRHADEIRGASGFELPAEGLKSAGVSPKEVDLAKRLVDDMTEHWKPEEFKDTYHEDLMRRIHEKIKAGETKEITKRTAEDGEEPRSAKIMIPLPCSSRASTKGAPDANRPTLAVRRPRPASRRCASSPRRAGRAARRPNAKGPHAAQ